MPRMPLHRHIPIKLEGATVAPLSREDISCFAREGPLAPEAISKFVGRLFQIGDPELALTGYALVAFLLSVRQTTSGELPLVFEDSIR